MGVTTYSSAIFNFLPQFAMDFYAAVRRHDHATVADGLRNFVIPYIDIRDRRKGYAVSIVKAGVRLIGRDCGPVRTPLVDLTPDELASLKSPYSRTLMSTTAPSQLNSQRSTHIRYAIVATLFLVSAFSYGDRVVLSIAAISFTRDLHLTPVKLSYLLSGFSWTYAAAQLPSGWLLDRFGTKYVYGISILIWSALAALVGFAGFLTGAIAFATILPPAPPLRPRAGPRLPRQRTRSSRLVPLHRARHRLRNLQLSQYFALVLFAPLMGWVAHEYGWKACFWILGVLGLLLFLLWSRVIHDVQSPPSHQLH